MHPLLAKPSRLAWYLLAWVPVGGVFWVCLDVGSNWPATTLAALAAALALLCAFASLPVWYTCRALPLAPRPARALAAHLLAALVGGGVLALLAGAVLAASPPLIIVENPELAEIMFGYAGVLLYLLNVAGYYIVLGAEAAGHAATLAREAELRALRAQINPHFLFNSLNSISALTGADPARARDMCVQLGDFFRQTLALGARGDHTVVPLSEELDLIRLFLAVEQVRFGARLGFDPRIAPAALTARLPPLLLQPLIENAVVHGISHLVEGGTVKLDASLDHGRLRLRVANPYDPETPPRRRGGLGLANVHGRLRAIYGGRATATVAATDGQFRVNLDLPLEQDR